jgi:hypothetical protein
VVAEIDGRDQKSHRHGDAYFVFDTIYHYVAIILVAAAIAAVEGLARIRRRSVLIAALIGWVVAGIGGNWWLAAAFIAVGIITPSLQRKHLQWLMVASMLVGATFSTIVDGVSPIGHRYHEFWVKPERQQEKEAAAKLIPSGDAVSATYWFTPHFTHRKQIYEFPNPWRSVNWGLTDDAKPDNPDTVKWLILDLRSLVGSPDLQIYQQVLADGEFQEIYHQSDIVVAKRVSIKPDGSLITPSTTMAP